jgi:hypothetical protein
MTHITDAVPSPAAVATPGEAGPVIVRLMAAMDALLAMIDEETALVRAGRLRDASKLERSKADFAQSYVTDMARLTAHPAAMAQAAPELLEAFRRRHAEFHDLLRINMTVLATAHAVSEDLIRGVSGELARKAAPQTYGATGRPAAPGASSIQPLAVNRNL